MSRLHRSLAVLILAVAVTASSLDTAGAAETDLPAAQAFEGHEVYYAGQEFEALPITHILGGPKKQATWTFIYGDCTPPPGASCFPPLEVQTWSACRRYHAIYDELPPGFGLKPPKPSPFRGAKAAWIPSAGGFEVYTGRTTVVVFADSRQVAKRAASVVLDVRDVTVPASLPAPVKGAIDGDLPCQGKRPGTHPGLGPRLLTSPAVP